MSTPFVVMCAPNGARKTKDDHPALPIEPAELADCAAGILAGGASIIHLHVRDAGGAHSLDTERYREAIAAVRERVGDALVIQVTTEACGIYTPDQQMAMVRELRPEAVSVALREICPDDASESAATDFYAWMNDARVMAQHIVYAPEDLQRFAALRDRGVIPDPSPFVLFVLGRYSESLTGDVAELDAFIDATPPDVTWAVCCFGRTEHEAAVAAAQAGGHARVGFENNLWLPDGQVAGDNTALVEVAAEAGRRAGRTIATADDVRGMFG